MNSIPEFTCPKCHGKGRVWTLAPDGGTGSRECPQCRGSGKSNSDKVDWSEERFGFLAVCFFFAFMYILGLLLRG